MRVTILTYVEEEGGTDADAVVPQVAEALRANDHHVSVLEVHGDVTKLVGYLARLRPDLVFNLLEMFADDMFLEVPAVGLLDLLGIPHTGGGPGELYLCQDRPSPRSCSRTSRSSMNDSPCSRRTRASRPVATSTCPSS